MDDDAETRQFRSGAGRLCLDFVRTLRYRNVNRQTIDELADPAALVRWITQFGPETGDAVAFRVTPGHVTLAGRLREAVIELIDTSRTGAGTCSPATRRLLNTTAAAPPPAPELHPDGHIRWVTTDGVSSTLSLIARDALDLARSPLAARIRNCANPECQVLFLDQSRPGARRWCSMGSCGNLAKKTRLRAHR